MIVISDTSSITTLLQIGKAGLLRQLYDQVLIPESVRSELLVSHPSLPEFLRCETVHDFRTVERLLVELDLGEAEAIVLALEQKADLLLIDERNGRRVALREGIPFTGLVGVLVESKRKHLIPSVREILSEIEDTTTFYVSEQTKVLALKSAGEL
jgi:predicted nucleic acid-binding protein